MVAVARPSSSSPARLSACRRPPSSRPPHASPLVTTATVTARPSATAVAITPANAQHLVVGMRDDDEQAHRDGRQLGREPELLERVRDLAQVRRVHRDDHVGPAGAQLLRREHAHARCPAGTRPAGTG